MRTTIAMLIVTVLFNSTGALAQTFVGTVVFAKGDVKSLKVSEDGKGNEKKQLIFEGKKYNYEKIKIGKKLLPGEFIQTGTNGKAKVVYANGDHFNIGPGTFISMPKSDAKDAKSGSSIDLLYGRLRSMISKDGPRNNLKVTTPATTAGVRGTDFFVRHNLSEGSSVTVLRGSVALPSAKNEKPIIIKKAQKAEVLKADAEVKVALAEKQDLLEIQQESVIQQNPEDIKDLSKETKEELKKLEASSEKVVLNDIKQDDPELYKKLEAEAKDGKINADTINTEVVAKLFKQAPGKIKSKPSEADLDASEEDIYKKYFETK